MKELLKLVIHIMRKGKFRHSGLDFTGMRTQALAHLYDHSKKRRASLKDALMKNLYLRTWISEAAYFRKSFKKKGGHLSSPDHKIAYIRIPRAASTSLSKTILQAKFLRLSEVALTAEQINYLADVYLEAEYVNQKPLDIFTVVRNPFARIVSVYREFFEDRQGPFIYEDYLFGILKKDFSFKEFVKALKVIPDQLKDQHLRPQHSFLRYYERKDLPVNVMKLEEPGMIEKFLQEHRLQFEAINRSETAYDYRDYYDQEGLQLVYGIYSADIRRFGYEGIFREIQFSIEHRPVHM